ncbi:hypothetical protein Btru_050150 [Bulinus truncatus]|nr:hypothetical protein Btru_050150 [Bulinus truncatus]
MVLLINYMSHGHELSNGFGVISLDEVNCTGTENHIVECGVGPQNWAVHDCSHKDDAGVNCEPPEALNFQGSRTIPLRLSRFDEMTWVKFEPFMFIEKMTLLPSSVKKINLLSGSMAYPPLSLWMCQQINTLRS